MSKGEAQDGGVMNDQTTTFPWQHTQMTSIQPRRISLSMHSEQKRRRGFDEKRIITGIDFRHRYADVPGAFTQPRANHRRRAQGETEPVWVSILGGLGVVAGLLACWILV